MTSVRTTFAVTAAALFATMGAALVTGSAAEAGGRGKEFFVQEYKFDKPMHGYSGHSGSYYCDYQRLPIRKCSVSGNGNEVLRHHRLDAAPNVPVGSASEPFSLPLRLIKASDITSGALTFAAASATVWPLFSVATYFY